MAAIALVALAAWLMRVRDIGSPLLRQHQHQRTVTHLPSSKRLLRIPVLSSLYEQRMELLAWTVGSATGAAYIASLGRSIVDLAKGPGSFRAYLTLVGNGNPYVALTGYF